MSCLPSHISVHKSEGNLLDNVSNISARKQFDPSHSQSSTMCLSVLTFLVYWRSKMKAKQKRKSTNTEPHEKSQQPLKDRRETIKAENSTSVNVLSFPLNSFAIIILTVLTFSLNSVFLQCGFIPFRMCHAKSLQICGLPQNFTQSMLCPSEISTGSLTGQHLF